MIKRVFALSIFFLLLVSCSNDSEPPATEEKEIFISAAASLSGALDKIKENYETIHPEVTLTLNLSGSGKLAQQIQQGAPVDVYLSANQYWMDVLKQDNLILHNTRINFTKNKLAMITHDGSNKEIRSLKNLVSDSSSQIAIGNPKSVPAGNYAKEALTNLGLWDKLTDHFVYAKDVSQVLTYVESENAEIGFVYGSDLYRTKSAQILKEIDSNLYSPIVYPAAVLDSSENPMLAKEFLEYLQSDSAQTILKNHGFTE